MKDVPYSKVANSGWYIGRQDDGRYPHNQVMLALLMDIRGELQRINRTLQCQETQAIPRLLRAIRSNTAKPRRAKAKARR